MQLAQYMHSILIDIFFVSGIANQTISEIYFFSIYITGHFKFV